MWQSWRLKPCGTPAAYRRHLRRGTPPCQRCKDAEKLRKQLAREQQQTGLLANRSWSRPDAP